MGLDLQLLGDVGQKRKWNLVTGPWRPTRKAKQAKLYGESKAVGIAATSVDAKKIVLGQGPISLDLAFVEVEVSSCNGLPLGVGKNRMAVHTA